MNARKVIDDDRFWLFSGLFGIAIFYLSLVWQTTGNVDLITTDCVFWGFIFWLLWNKRDRLKYNSDFVSSLVGVVLLGTVCYKTIFLFGFEARLLHLLPISSAIALALIASGIKNICQYYRELFFAWFLFFPTGVIGYFIDNLIHVTVINAKFATYFLYYLGFQTASYGNEVIINLPELGQYKAIVDYPCAGLPMIILILKLGLLSICCVRLTRKYQIFIPLFSIALGFILGVIRVCILTLLIPHQLAFEYWHGNAGSQIFSTLAIVIFSGVCYWILQESTTAKSKTA